MSVPYDVIIIGSGPAGVSAAFPLVEAGLRVAMLDGGAAAGVAPPQGDFLALREADPQQWTWMIGRDFHALRMRDAVSPKLRVPTQAFAFSGFADANRIVAEDFVGVGSLASGGLSNAWGCGVARFSGSEGRFPFALSDLDASYDAVARRMGISGGQADDLSDYFGLDAFAEPPLPMDGAHQALWRGYQGARARVRAHGVRIGRSRVAVLSRDRGARLACNLSGNCLFGCSRGAMYSAAHDLALLRRKTGFSWKPACVVHRFTRQGPHWVVHARSSDGSAVTFEAPRLIVAAGTLASTRLVAQALDHRAELKLQSSPTAAFLLWLPARLGAPRETGFGLGQLSFTVGLKDGCTAFGSTFATTGLPLSEFARHLPLGRAVGMKVLRHLLSSCVVGNLFLPGDLCDASVRLGAGGELVIRGGYAPAVPALLSQARRQLTGAWRALGAWVLPGSFRSGPPGSDIHYIGTLPMTENPAKGQTSPAGEVQGLPEVYVVDGACMPALPEKSHTLTLMANADRIGRLIAGSIQ